MFKFMMVFYQPDDIPAFENTYNDLLALVERMPDIKRRQVINVVGSPQGASPYYRILEVYFEDQKTMQTSMLGERGQEAGAEINKLPTNTYEMIFAEVFEEDGATTPTQTPPTGDTDQDATT